MNRLYAIVALHFCLLVCFGHTYAQFIQPVEISTGVSQYQQYANHKVLDFDKDGKNDIVQVSNSGIRWLKNLGEGEFGSPQQIGIESAGKFAILAHVDADPYEDFVTVSNKRITWFRNLGNLSFGAEVEAAAIPDSMPFLSFDASSLGVADINKDGKTDFICTGIYAQPCIVPHLFFQVLSSGTGAYSLRFPDPFTSVQFEEFYFSGEMEVIHLDDQQSVYIKDENYDLFKILDSDSLYKRVPYPTSMGHNTKLIATGDLVGLPEEDLILASTNYVTGQFKLGICQSNQGVFTEPLVIESILNITNLQVDNIQIGDIDNDSKNDILVYFLNSFGLCWYKNLGNGQFSSRISIMPPNGTYYLVHVGDLSGDDKSDLLAFSRSPYKLEVWSSGITNGSYVGGHVFYDGNSNCIKDDNISIITPQVIQFLPGNYLATSSSNGPYGRFLPFGSYQTQLVSIPPSILVQNICFSAGENISIDSAGIVVENNIGVQGIACPLLKVTISSGARVPCRKSQTLVAISNEGYKSASQVALTVKMPVYSAPISCIPDNSTHTYDAVTNTHQWLIPSVAAQTTVSIIITDSTHCINTIVGKTQCIKANIAYDGGCQLPYEGWDGSDLISSTECIENSQVRFHIKNRGLDMADSSSLIVYQNNLVAARQKLKLDAGQTAVYEMPAMSYATTLKVFQRPHHPYSAYDATYATGCNPSTSPSNISQIFLSNERRDEATFCSTIRSSFDPNDKTVFPQGWGDAGNVPTGTELQYRIRFQNKGNAPAYFVQIRDTLSPLLDLSTLKGIAGTGGYSLNFKVEGTLDKPVLIFTYPTIYLPDSATDPVRSQGAVIFTIQPKAGLPQLTQIRNKASIIFDINEPVVTNTTLTTINDSLPMGPAVVLGMEKVRVLSASFSVYPNPSDGEITISLSEATTGKVQVLDAVGRSIFKTEIKTPGQPMPIIQLPEKGLYLIQVEDPKTGLHTKKLIVE